MDRAAEDMKAFGASAEKIAQVLEQMRHKAAPDVFWVHPANVVAVKLFQGLQTQFAAVAMSTWSSAQIRRTGLRYEVIEPTARMMGLTMTDDDFARLRIMEVEALVAWSRQS